MLARWKSLKENPALPAATVLTSSSSYNSMSTSRLQMTLLGDQCQQNRVVKSFCCCQIRMHGSIHIMYWTSYLTGFGIFRSNLHIATAHSICHFNFHKYIKNLREGGGREGVNDGRSSRRGNTNDKRCSWIVNWRTGKRRRTVVNEQ